MEHNKKMETITEDINKISISDKNIRSDEDIKMACDTMKSQNIGKNLTDILDGANLSSMIKCIIDTDEIKKMLERNIEQKSSTHAEEKNPFSDRETQGNPQAPFNEEKDPFPDDKGGEENAMLLNDKKENEKNLSPDGEKEDEKNSSNDDEKEKNVSSDSEKVSPPDIEKHIKEIMKNTNVSSMLNHISNNPDQVSKVMEESMKQMTPEMIDKAKKMATAGRGQQIVKEMQRKGIDPMMMKKQFLTQEKLLRKLNQDNQKTKDAVLVTLSRQLKIRKVPINSANTAINLILKTESPVQLSCSRLAIGPLKGKTISIWYNQKATGKNKRASKIAGFPIGGELLIVMDEGNISVKEISSIEEILS